MRPRHVGAVAVGCLVWSLLGYARGASQAEERAYSLNREGMIAMSEARFDDAIAAFTQAADLVADYGIAGKPLMYTPVFMTAWASEKIDHTREACAAYRRYLQIAVEHPVEPTKVEHANAYVSTNCKDSVPKE